MLLGFLDVNLPPVPQVLGLLDCTHLFGAVSEHLAFEFIFLQGIEILSQVLKPKYAGTDFLELSEHHMLFQTIECNLQHILVCFLSLIVDMGTDETLALGLLDCV